MRKTCILTILAALFALEPTACSPGCPDLALMAVTLEITRDLDQNLLTVDVAEDGGASVLSEAPIHELESLNGGIYDITFYHDGENIGDLTQVCTVGDLTGCDAEDAAASDTPRITITNAGGAPEVVLESNGACP